MKITTSEIIELQKYLEVLRKLENRKVKTSDIQNNNFDPFINNILIFNYNSEVCYAYDTFPVVICNGFTIDKRNKRIFLKGINLNYLSISIRDEMTKLLVEIKKRIKVITSLDGEVSDNDLEFQYNPYEVFKAQFNDYVGSSYKKYDIANIMGLKIIPKEYWNMMVRFPIDTFLKLNLKDNQK